MKLIPLFLIAGLSGSPAFSGGKTVKVADHQYPLELRAHGASWKLSGTEHYRYKVFFSVFTAALYVNPEPENKRLTFTYTRKIKADDLREQAMKTLKTQNNAGTLNSFAELTREIQKAYEDVDAGDHYTLTVIQNRGIWLERNGKEVFFSENAAFGFWYLDIWLGDPPISESLKDALMGEASS